LRIARQRQQKKAIPLFPVGAQSPARPLSGRGKRILPDRAAAES
jgi:hypothetical protein